MHMKQDSIHFPGLKHRKSKIVVCHGICTELKLLTELVSLFFEADEGDDNQIE